MGSVEITFKHIHPKEGGQGQPQRGVDEDDEEPVDEGVANAFGTGFRLLREKAHRHRNHGEHTGRQQRRQARNQSPTRTSRRGLLLVHLLCSPLERPFGPRKGFAEHATFVVVPFSSFARVVAPVFGGCTVVGSVRGGLNVGHANFNAHFLRGKAHAGIAHHEVHVPLDDGVA